MTVTFLRYPITFTVAIAPEHSLDIWMTWWLAEKAKPVLEPRPRTVLVKRRGERFIVEPDHWIAPIYEVTL